MTDLTEWTCRSSSASTTIYGTMETYPHKGFWPASPEGRLQTLDEAFYLKCRTPGGAEGKIDLQLSPRECTVAWVEAIPKGVGLGREACKIAEKRLREWGCESSFLCPADEVAQEFWEHMGYKEMRNESLFEKGLPPMRRRSVK